jgi:hypothetical protein
MKQDPKELLWNTLIGLNSNEAIKTPIVSSKHVSLANKNSDMK